jgi:hypothetical protein
MLVLEHKIKTNKVAFIERVKVISKALKIDPNWLMLVMNNETSGTFSPSIQNTKYPVAGGYATGLIQFIPSTAKGLGTTVDKLKVMSNVEQLDWVYKYFKSYTGKIKNYADLYMVTFFPVAVGKPDSFVLQAKNISADSVARLNPGFDLNKDKTITAGEARKAFLKHVPSELLAYAETVVAEKKNTSPA